MFSKVHAQITNPAVPGLEVPSAAGAVLGDLISTIIGAFIMIAGIAALLYLLYGGFNWITAGGDKQNLENARNRITNAIVGLIVVAATWAIVTLISQIFGLDILNFTIPTVSDGTTQ